MNNTKVEVKPGDRFRINVSDYYYDNPDSRFKAGTIVTVKAVNKEVLSFISIKESAWSWDLETFIDNTTKIVSSETEVDYKSLYEDACQKIALLERKLIVATSAINECRSALDWFDKSGIK